MRTSKLVIVLAGLAAASPALAQLPGIALRTPIEALRAAQDREADAIAAAVATAADAAATAADRIDAVRRLSGIGFDYLLDIAPGLVLGDAAVAVEVVNTLGAQIAMLPAAQHAGHGGVAASPLDAYQAALVARCIEVLRLALNEGAPAVRHAAAPILIAKADAPSYDTVARLMKDGTFTEREGIGYLTLGPAALASPYIAPFAQSEDRDVRAAAVTQLSYNPDYTTQVREIALDPGSDPYVVQGALDGLARIDTQFTDYGPSLIENTALPAEVRAKAFDAVVQSTLLNRVPDATALELAPILTDAARIFNTDRVDAQLKQFQLQYDIKQ